MPAQGRDAESGQRNGTATAALRIVVVQDATAALHLLADVEDAVVEVDVRPAQADDLTPAEAHGDGETKAASAVVREASKEIERLVEGPGMQFLVVGTGRLDELGDVAGDQFLTAGGRESRAQNSVGFLGGCSGGLLLQADEEPAHVGDAKRLQPLSAERGTR